MASDAREAGELLRELETGEHEDVDSGENDDGSD